MNKKLFKNTVYLYLFTAIKMLFPLITLPYLTRVLTVETFGVVAYVKAYVSYIQLILDFGFLLSATKDIVKVKNNNEVGYIVGDTIIEKCLLAIIASIVTLIVSNSVGILANYKSVIWLYFVACCITILLPDFLFRGLEKMENIVIPFAVSKIVVLILTFILVKSDNDYLMIPVLEIAGNLIAAIISLSFIRRLNINIRFNNIKKWLLDLKESSIYFFSNFATTFFGALTTLVVGIYMNKVDIAYWSICMQIVAAAKSMYNPISNSLYPYMITNKDIKLVQKVALTFSVPLIIGCIFVLFWGESIMTVIGGKDYAQAGYVLKFLLPVLVSSFYSMLYGWPVLGAIGKIKETTVSTILAAVIQLVCIIILIALSNFNLISLAICCGISEISLLIIRLWIFSKNKFLLST